MSNKQVIEIVAPVGYEFTDIKLQLKPVKTSKPEPTNTRIPVNVRRRSPMTDGYVLGICEICGGPDRDDRGYCASCFLDSYHSRS